MIHSKSYLDLVHTSQESHFRTSHAILRWIVVCLVWVLLPACDASNEAAKETVKKPGDFILFTEGKPMAAIVLSESAVKAKHKIGNLRHLEIPAEVPNDISRAVDLFREDIRTGYGVDLPLGENTGLPNRIEIDLVSTALEEEDTTKVSFPSPDVMRIRGGESGICRTLFYLLEEFGGVRYLFQGSMRSVGFGAHFPKKETFGIPCEEITHTSAFPLGRSASQTAYGSHWEDLRNRLYWWNWEARLGSKERVARSHDLRRIAFPLDQYGKDKPEPDEAAFPILQGKRVLPWKHEVRKNSHWQPRYGSQEAVDEAVKNLLAFLREHPDTLSLSLSVNDGGGHSETETDHLVESYYRWVNAVAEKVTKEFPNVMLGVIGYREVAQPPSFKLHPNVVAFLTFDFHATADPDVREKREKWIRDWGNVAKIGVYSYDTGDTSFTLPRIYFKEMQHMIRYLRDHGGMAAYTERSYTTAAEGPKMYLYYKLLENPDLDLEATIQDWCKAAVGADAALSLRKYYAFWEEFWKTKATKTAWWNSRNSIYLSLPPFGSYMYGLERGDMARCRELMNKVVEEADKSGTDEQRKRAHFLMAIFEWYEANAVACGAEYFTADGKLPDSTAALNLIRNIPNAQKAFEKSLSLPHKIEGWIAPGVSTKDLAAADVVAGSLSSVSGYFSDENVVEELGRLSANPEASPQIRFLAGVMLKSAKGDNEGNKVVDGSIEGPNPEWDVKAVHGKASVSNEVAAHGNHSLKCEIDHPNYTVSSRILDAKPHTDYYFSARIFIPKDQPVAEGRVNIYGNGTYRRGDQFYTRGGSTNIPDLGLKPGEWNYVSAMIPGRNLTDSLRLNIRFKSFERGDVAYIDDVQVYEVPKENETARKKQD